jgi:coenzyme PQQ precursor peptide PqqA
LHRNIGAHGTSVALLQLYRQGTRPILKVWGMIQEYNRKYPIGEIPMAWTTPTLVEICIGLEINGYLPAEF